MNPLSYLNRANEWLALHATAVLSSMGSFWAITLALLWSQFVDPSTAPQVGWWSSSFFQAVALPILGKGQDLQAARAEAHRMEIEAERKQDHEAIMAELAMMRETVEAVHSLAGGLRKLTEAVGRIEDGLKASKGWAC